MPNFFVKWKGRESGPFSGEEIRGMFETGKIGLLHEIRAEGGDGWTMLKDFDFSAVSDPEGGARRADSDDLQYAAYFLCGASFLHLFIFLISGCHTVLLRICPVQLIFMVSQCIINRILLSKAPQKR